MSRVKYLILGHGRHGKDETAYLLAKKLGLKFISSSEFACMRVVYPALKDSYPSWRACFNDRHNKRAVWFRLIDEYNSPDRTRLAKELLEEYDIYVGMRNVSEYLACIKEGIFDHIIWVDAMDRQPAEPATSFTITYDPSIMHYLDNNGRLEWLESNVNKLIKEKKFPESPIETMSDTKLLALAFCVAVSAVLFAGLGILFL